MRLVRYCGLVAGAVGLVLAAVGWICTQTTWWQAGIVLATAGGTVAMGLVPALVGFQFTAWIVTAVCVALVYPDRCLRLGNFELTHPWMLLAVIQVVMFGMGTQMSLRDFAGVARMPWGVFVGLFCQFTIMPLLGYVVAMSFGLPDEIAAGVILVGSCSSGLASNVMVFLAGGNVALSITLTSVATMLAPVMTPMWMKVLAGTLVEFSFLKMMLDTIKIVIVPLIAAFLSDYLSRAGNRVRSSIYVVAVCCGLGLAMAIGKGWLALARESSLSVAYPWLVVTAFLAGAVVAGVVYFRATMAVPGLQRLMPRLSMLGIVYFVAVTTAAGRDDLLRVGILLLAASIIHNTGGYLCGFWLSRWLGLDRNSARTVAFEVGLQNGGMAVSLATMMGKLPTVGLAAVIFSPWMNVSGFHPGQLLAAINDSKRAGPVRRSLSLPIEFESSSHSWAPNSALANPPQRCRWWDSPPRTRVIPPAVAPEDGLVDVVGDQMDRSVAKRHVEAGRVPRCRNERKAAGRDDLGSASVSRPRNPSRCSG